MRLLGRWFGGRMWVFLLLAVVVFALQLLLPWPVLLTYGLLLSAAIVLVADPVRVAVLSVVCLALGAVAAFVDPAPAPGYWERYPWLLPFAVLAVVLARVERDRVRRIARSVQLLDEVVGATSQPIFAKRFGAPGQPATFDLANDAWRRAVGIEAVQVRGLSDTEVFSAEALAAMRPDEEQVARTGSPATFEQHLVLADGEERTYLTTIFPLLDDDAAVTGVGGIATDVTERARAEERLAAVFAHSPVPTLRMVTGGDRRTQVLDANEAVRALVGLEAVGMGADELFGVVHPQDRPMTRSLMDSVVAGASTHHDGGEDGRVVGREIRLLDAEGRVRWVILSVSLVGRPSADGEQELIVQFEDITTLKTAEAALTERALTDPVTGLPNRYSVTDRLAMALTRLVRRPGTVCVLFCDLDQFKQVNDAFGHEVGDELLAAVGARLVAAVRPEDSVGRLGGDEFVVVCEGFDDPREAATLAGRLQDGLREPWSYAGHRFAPAASIGIAFTSDPATAPGDLLRQADLAMYRAKDSGATASRSTTAASTTS